MRVCACLVESGRAAGDLNAVLEPADGGARLRRRRTRGLQAGVAFAAPRLRRGRAGEPRHEVHLQVNPRHLALQVKVDLKGSSQEIFQLFKTRNKYVDVM